MGILGDVLELCATSSSRWTTFHATAEQYRHRERQRRSVDKTQAGIVPLYSTPPGDPLGKNTPPIESKSSALMWANGTKRIRVEEQSTESEGHSLTVQNEKGSWARSASGEVMTSITGDGIGPIDVSGWSLLVDPGTLIQGTDLEVLGFGEVAGRPTYRVVARPKEPAVVARYGVRGPLMYLGWMGDEMALDLDTATGVALRLESFVDGEIFRSLTVTTAAFDPGFDDAMFDETPPADTPAVRTHQMAEPLAAIAARVAFTLFAPSRANCVAFVRPEKDDLPEVVSVHVIPSLPTRPGQRPESLGLTESASAEPLADPAEWEPIDLNGRPARIWQPANGGEVHVRMEIDGTHIWLRGLVDREKTIAVAESLVAVTPW